jgi:glutathione peroxidase
MTTVYDFSAATLDGTEQSLKVYEGQVLLIVNTASACGFTPQYAQLEELQRALGPRGFSVLGFPCNQFGGQEPGSAQEIAAFCSQKYDVTFPMFAKIDVNGDKALPLFDHLKTEKPGLLGSSIKWNFTKFLVDRAGKVVARYNSITAPGALTHDIEKLL